MFNWTSINRDDNGIIILLYRHERILTEGIVTQGSSVLDLGGWGILASRLQEEGATCIIMDNFSEDQYFPDRVKSLPHINGDILDTDRLPERGAGTFDVVTCFEMLEHCRDQSLAVKNIYTMLKPVGTLVGTFPIPGGTHPADDPDVKFLTKEELLSIFKEAGFTDILIEPTGSITKEEEPCSLYFRARK